MTSRTTAQTVTFAVNSRMRLFRWLHVGEGTRASLEAWRAKTAGEPRRRVGQDVR